MVYLFYFGFEFYDIFVFYFWDIGEYFWEFFYCYGSCIVV